MKCLRCQHENRPQARFCEECASPLSRTCAHCGAQLTTTAKFCPECAGRAAEPATPDARFASPAAYTPKHLAEKILRSRSALEGERKQVTVLFCDIVESTGLAERLDPEAMHELMDKALRLMAEAVHRYQGTVNQFLGDGLMALFGAPVALEDHALRAVQAALAIRETVNGYSEQLKRERSIEVHLRLGLNSGPVVVGRIGDDLRMDYTAAGDTTNLAARMQVLAEPGAILITEATYRLAEGYIRSEPLGSVRVKGRSDPVVAYRVTGRRPLRTRLELSAERGLTPLIGRERELQLLHERLARARAGQGQVVGIAGEPGAGKSRLLYEFRKSCEGERLTWLAGHCVAYGQTTPYLPLLEILRANFQIEEEDNPLQIRDKLRQHVHQLDPALEATLPWLGELLGLPIEDERLRQMDAKDKRQKTFEAVRALTMAGSQHRTIVVIVEDLHWIDRTSEDYLTFVIESLAGMSVLLLLSYRPGYVVRSADKPHYTQVALDLLTEAEAESMVGTLLGSRHLPADLLPIIWQKAEGNPLFVEETTRSLSERGLLVRTEGEIHWARDGVVELPMTVQDIIRARIDGLEEPVKRTVQTAAVIGREFGHRLLVRISEMANEVQHYVETLKHLELIHEKQYSPELEYIFKHAVTQDVAYQSLLSQRRKEIHGIIGEAIQELYADRLDEQAAILAYHYARSNRRERAVDFILRAGDRAARLSANAEATTFYEEALRILADLPASTRRDELHVDATIKLASVATTRPHFERDLKNLDAADAIARRLGDQRRTAQVLYWIARTHYVRGNLNDAIQFAEQSLALGDALGDDDLVVWPVNLTGRIYTVLGDYVKATSMLQRCVPLFERMGNLNELATASGILGVVLAATGEFPEALKFGDQGLRIAQEIQNLPAQAAACHYRALVHERQGQWGSAVEDCRAGLEVAERIPDPFRIYALTCLLGYGLFRLGEEQRGLETLQRGIRLAEDLGTTYLLAWAVTWLCDCHLARREWDAALATASRALSLVATGPDVYGEGLASRCYGEALGESDPSRLEEAEAHIRRAIALQEDKAMKPQLARSYVACARLLAVKGEVTKARAYVDRARGLFEPLGMQWHQQWLTEAFPDT
jgi:class 3 adenylate cyclase/tetratricopeptide (TPR) repeat protein